ncbi:DUF4386 domain-containing protein [Georgenia muralis]|uniref:Uncharacterized protein DUF4386 n=1 Tax=Georgenia muralis TaxID=154117 RepID=A0A3N4Z7N1_9MICO|nr:DUF4386 domain-containing protein [Georgenia muralis]RPF28317.1 uncharacterized protein DUF4386 [Georgenia muralis]
MTDHVDTRLPAQPLPPAPASSTRWTVRRAGAVAGLSLLLMAGTGAFAYFVVLEGMITPGDAVSTTAEITGREGTFRLGVLAWLAIVVLDVLVAWALYRVFRPVSVAVAVLAAAFRLVYTAVLLVAVGQLLRALDVLGSGPGAASSPDQVSTQVMLELSAFQGIYDIGLLLFGIHLVLLGYLATRSSFVPTVVGALLVLAGAGYAFDTVAAVLGLDMPIRVSELTFLGELLLGLWLLLAGARLDRAEHTPLAVRRAR